MLVTLYSPTLVHAKIHDSPNRVIVENGQRSLLLVAGRSPTISPELEALLEERSFVHRHQILKQDLGELGYTKGNLLTLVVVPTLLISLPVVRIAKDSRASISKDKYTYLSSKAKVILQKELAALAYHTWKTSPVLVFDAADKGEVFCLTILERKSKFSKNALMIS